MQYFLEDDPNLIIKLTPEKLREKELEKMNKF